MKQPYHRGVEKMLRFRQRNTTKKGMILLALKLHELWDRKPKEYKEYITRVQEIRD